MTKKCHFIGIGGIGMSALARLVLNKNYQVSGSDVSRSSMTQALAVEGANIFFGHAAENITSDMTVVYSTDIRVDNPEYEAATKLNCQLMHRSEFMQVLMKNYQSIAVAGTHGKTTTSALLAWVLESSGLAPSYAIGGILSKHSSNAMQGTGKYFIAEACESDASFLNYSPNFAVVTNIDFDHLDFFGSKDSLISAFQSFMDKVDSSNLFLCGDDPCLKKINHKGITYGFGAECEVRGLRYRQHGWLLSFDIEFKGKFYKNVEVSLIGKHNALNALAVFGLALQLGLSEDAIRQALRSFDGVLRRCEKKADQHGILFLDDYAHHPTELKATLKAIRGAIGERRLVAVYQPHRYSRAKDCEGLYDGVFNEADFLFVNEIYSAGEKPHPGVSHENIINQVQIEMGARCSFLKRNQASLTLSKFLRPHDVLVTLGAGDITKLSEEILNQFAFVQPKKLKLGVIYGGRSVEYDVSLLSAANILKSIKPDYYELEKIEISRQGFWSTSSDSRNDFEVGINKTNRLTIDPKLFLKIMECDIFFPILHGTYGEDGTIQGFFETISKAYVGCDYRSSSICMDKVLTKRLVKEAGIDTLPYISFTFHEFKQNEQEILDKIEANLQFPLFVKPVHLGSSIGISKVVDRGELIDAISFAFRFDAQLLIEKSLDHPREIEFSVFGNENITVFPPGEIFTDGKIHDYDSKYGQNPKKPAAKFNLKASLSDDKIREGMEIAKRSYQTTGCQGMARVDTFLDENQKFWFNEINTIPGFTAYSLFPLICEANALKLDHLIDRLIILGLHRRRHQDRLLNKSEAGSGS